MTGERTRKSRGWRERRPILRWSRETAHKSHPARAPRPARGRTLLGRERQPQPVCTPLWLGHRHRNTLPPFKILSFTDTPSSPSLVFLPPLSHPPGKSRKVMPFILRARNGTWHPRCDSKSSPTPWSLSRGCFHSRRGVTHRVRLECDPDIPVAPGEQYYVLDPSLDEDSLP